MKKLMTAIAVAFAAAVVNAAAVSWSAGGIVDPWATQAAGKNTPASGWVGYLVLASDLDTISSGLTSGDTSVLAAAVDHNTTTAKGQFAAGAATGNVAAGSQDFYVIVFNAANVDDATSFYVSTKASAVVDASLDTPITFSSQATNSKNVANWTAMSVPEPTSGLLLLLGMAGLALKRKRA